MRPSFSSHSRSVVKRVFRVGDDQALAVQFSNGAPTPGERVAPVAGAVPIGSGATPRFALFAVREPEVDRLLQDYKALLEPAVRPPLADGGMRLVRPDGYAAAVARRGDVGVIARYLDGLLPAASAG